MCSLQIRGKPSLFRERDFGDLYMYVDMFYPSQSLTTPSELRERAFLGRQQLALSLPPTITFLENREKTMIFQFSTEKMLVLGAQMVWSPAA